MGQSQDRQSLVIGAAPRFVSCNAAHNRTFISPPVAPTFVVSLACPTAFRGATLNRLFNELLTPALHYSTVAFAVCGRREDGVQEAYSPGVHDAGENGTLFFVSRCLRLLLSLWLFDIASTYSVYTKVAHLAPRLE